MMAAVEEGDPAGRERITFSGRKSGLPLMRAR
jgi:hypothetical protein